MKTPKTNEFLDAPLAVINIGLDTFANELKEQGVSVVNLDWAPPARGNPKLAALLSKLGA